MKLYNYELDAFITFLHSLPIKEGSDSRMRTRFKKLLTEKKNVFMEEIQEINGRYLIVEQNGQPRIIDDKYQFKDNPQRLEEIMEVSNEVIIIEQNIERKTMLLSVKNSVLSYSPDVFEGDEAERYDRFCEIVEQIEYDS